MFNRIVEKVVRDGFKRLSSGDYEASVGKFAPRAYFRFFGEHAMGAELCDVAAIRQWFQRMLRLFPGIQFDVLDIKVSGMPWNTLVVTRLGIRATLRDGRAYRNSAMQMVRLRWGKIVEDLVYEDTHILIEALSHMSQQGVEEASAHPMIDALPV